MRQDPVISSSPIDALYRSEWDRLVRLATLLTGHTGVAADIVQDAFVAVTDRLDSIDQPAAYLRSTVVNRCWS